jgi:cytidylate kinase
MVNGAQSLAGVPVIAIDGPSASGKGTIAAAVAADLRYHYLDSGALYRIVGLVATRAGLNLDQDLEVSSILLNLNIKFKSSRIWVNAEDVSDAIRGEQAGKAASRVAALPSVRQGLVGLQHGFRQHPGLVADGRDMGSVIFPDARLKIYLTASPEERAKRRYKQLIAKGSSANMTDLLQDIQARDFRDSHRSAAPLLQEADAHYIDSTALSIERVVAEVLDLYDQVQRV